MSAQTESKEAPFQMLISEHALVRHCSSDTRLSGAEVDSGAALPTGIPGTSATSSPQSGLSSARRETGSSQGPQRSDGRCVVTAMLWVICTYGHLPHHPALATVDNYVMRS